MALVQPLLRSEGSSALAPSTVPEVWPGSESVTAGPALRLVGGTAVSRSIVAEAARPRLRVTRAGRLAVTISVAFLLGLGALTAVCSMAAPGSVAVDRTVVVLEGQTLSGIAATELPGLPVLQGVARIQLANDLSTTSIHAGQRLAIPRLG